MKIEKNGIKFDIKFRDSEVCDVRICEFYKNGEFINNEIIENMYVKSCENSEYPKMICFAETINFSVTQDFANKFIELLKQEKDFEKIRKARKIVEKAEKQNKILTEKEQKEKLNTMKTINEGGCGYYHNFGISKEKYDCAKKILESIKNKGE